jgi:hypothetical protein
MDKKEKRVKLTLIHNNSEEGRKILVIIAANIFWNTLIGLDIFSKKIEKIAKRIRGSVPPKVSFMRLKKRD